MLTSRNKLCDHFHYFRGKNDDNEEAGKMFVGGLSWETTQGECGINVVCVLVT